MSLFILYISLEKFQLNNQELNSYNNKNKTLLDWQ